MAKYRDGIYAQVGDFVRCGTPNCAWCDRSRVFKVADVFEYDVRLVNETSRHASDLFELAPTPKEPQVLPSPVRVQWPEQEQLKMDDLSRGDWFVFVDDPQTPCVAFSGGQHIQVVKTDKWPEWTLLTNCTGTCKRAVRRLRNPLPLKYEVI